MRSQKSQKHSSLLLHLLLHSSLLLLLLLSTPPSSSTSFSSPPSSSTSSSSPPSLSSVLWSGLTSSFQACDKQNPWEQVVGLWRGPAAPS